MKIFKLFFAIFSLALLTLAGCRTTAPQENLVTDDLGRSVTIKSVPQRIISLSPNTTEIIYALGVEDRLVGVTTYCNYPEGALDKPKVSEYSNIDMEKVVAANPDLILASTIHKSDAIPAFEKLGIAVLTIEPETLDGTIKDIELLGRICSKTQEAGVLASGLKERIQAITAKTSQLAENQKPRVFFLTWHDPLWTVGSSTVIDELITKAGGANIASDLKGHSQIDLESVIERNPQIIFVMSSMGDQDTSFNYIREEPRFQTTEAMKNAQVYKVDSDIFGRMTPRLVDGLETMAKLIHPEIFK
jgi:iron complex transport system substrate-binding protein